jgi:hypothetical protein
MNFEIYYNLDTVHSYGLYTVKSCDALILFLQLYFCYTSDFCLWKEFVPCIAKLCDTCECSVLRQGCIQQSNIVYDQFHIQAFNERVIEP